MSAYVVDPSTIARILGAITWDKPDAGPARDFGLRRIMEEAGWPMNRPPELERLARAMWDMNVAAVCQRYPDKEKPEDYPWPGLPQVYPPGNFQGYKSLQCFSYQCAEGDVPTWPLYQTLEKVCDAMAHGIMSTLWGYDNAEWG